MRSDEAFGDQRGTVTAEQVAVVALVAAVIGAVWTLTLPERTAEAGEQAVDCLFTGDADCFEPSDPEPSTPTPPPGFPTPRPTPPTPPPGFPTPQPTPTPEPYEPDPPPTLEDCRDLPFGDRLQCGLDVIDDHEYRRAYAFEVGPCTGLLAYAQIRPGVDTTSTYPSPHDGAVRAELLRDGSSADGCRMEVRVLTEPQGIGFIEGGWTDWSEHGEILYGQAFIEAEVRVTEPDGTVTVIRIVAGDGQDVGPGSDEDLVVNRH